LADASHKKLNYYSPFESWRVAYLAMMESDSPLYCPYASSRTLDEAVLVKLEVTDFPPYNKGTFGGLNTLHRL